MVPNLRLILIESSHLESQAQSRHQVSPLLFYRWIEAMEDASVL